MSYGNGDSLVNRLAGVLLLVLNRLPVTALHQPGLLSMARANCTCAGTGWRSGVNSNSRATLLGISKLSNADGAGAEHMAFIVCEEHRLITWHPSVDKKRRPARRRRLQPQLQT
jgi:hypothetical protein